MKFTTIWTLGGATLREKLHRTREWAEQRIAQSLPERIKYWAFMQTTVVALRGYDGAVPNAPLDYILRNLPGEPR